MTELSKDIKNYLIYISEFKKDGKNIIYPIEGGWFPLGTIFFQNNAGEEITYDYGYFYYDDLRVLPDEKFIDKARYFFPFGHYFKDWPFFAEVAYSKIGHAVTYKKTHGTNEYCHGVTDPDTIPPSVEKLLGHMMDHLLNEDYPISFYNAKIETHLDFLTEINLFSHISTQRYLDLYICFDNPKFRYYIIRETLNHYNSTDYTFLLVSNRVMYTREYKFTYYCCLHMVEGTMQLDILAVAVSYKGDFIYMVTNQDMELYHCILFPTDESGELIALRDAMMHYLGLVPNTANHNETQNEINNNQDEEDDNNEDLATVLQRKLDSIVGLKSAKEIIMQQFKLLQVEKKRRDMGISDLGPTTRHMLFTGNPGTGKTMIARIMVDMFKDMGIINKDGPFIEADRGDLVGEYIGQTAPKMKKVFDAARGGALFIDEAYSLYSNAGSNDFGREAIDELVKLMEDYKNDTIVILAGYTNEMNKLLSMNPGLKSRIPIHIDFPDYNPHELRLIAKSMLEDKKFQVSEEVLDQIEKELGRLNVGADAGNARLVRNFVEKIINRQALRLSSLDCSKEDLVTIKLEDIPGISNQQSDDGFDLDSTLNSIIGLGEVKNRIKQLEAEIRIKKIREKKGLPVDNQNTLHFIFSGNPGTGKITMARVLAQMLHKLNIIPSDLLVETSRKDLVAGYVGQTASKTAAVFSSAAGGVLFIDEAYSLTSANSQDFGHEAVDTLVKLMEDNKNTVVILAGYTNEMRHFLNSNPGLASRFPDWIEFPDYNEEDLLKIGKEIAKKKGYVLSPEAENRVLELMKEQKRLPNFGNGRVVRNCIEKSISKQNMRILNIDESEMTDEDLMVLLGEDITL